MRMILSSPGTAIFKRRQDIWARTGRYGSSRYKSIRGNVPYPEAVGNLALLRSLTPAEWNLYGITPTRC